MKGRFLGNAINDEFLLYRAACGGAWGKRTVWKKGAITDALFVYLEGEPEPQSMEALRCYMQRPLVCLSAAWEKTIHEHYPMAGRCQRTLMVPRDKFDLDTAVPLPDEFVLKAFDETIFSKHPFTHGENYSTYEAFRESGSGAAILHDGKIVVSASSFLSYQGEVELDVSTEAAYQRMGLATACVRQMLCDCQRRGIIVHWDAQNEASRRLAEKFGFHIQKTYWVYILSTER